jgi:hypothetical protein
MHLVNGLNEEELNKWKRLPVTSFMRSSQNPKKGHRRAPKEQEQLNIDSLTLVQQKRR